MKKSSHWYDLKGTPCHVMPNKAKGGTRPTTLRDAKALGLLPSVTGILEIFDKPQLNDWKLEQMTAEFQRRMKVLNDRKGSEGLYDAIADIAQRDFDALHADIVERAFAQVEDAADAGEKVHKGAELALQGLEYDEAQPILLPELKQEFPLATFLNPIRAFVKEHGIIPTGHEVRIVNRAHGYAGTGDLPMSCSRGVGFLDFKTRKTKPGKPVKAYDTQVMQIAAYHAAHYGVIPTPTDFACGCNLFISTTEPGRIEAVWYSAEEIARAYDAFVAACALWRFAKGYDPRHTAQVAA